MKIYLAGKMSGKPYFNREAFDNAAKLLREKGHVVFSPPEYSAMVYGKQLIDTNENGDEKEAVDNFGFDIKKIMSTQMAFIAMEADAVVLLPGWQDSRGARVEKAYADLIGVQVVELNKFLS